MAVEPIPTGPLDVAPDVGTLPLIDLLAILRHSLRGAHLGTHDRLVIERLAAWGAPTVLTVASWLERVRAVAAAEHDVANGDGEG